ncbi:MAG: galactose mutarotase, partial [Actinomycetota bacterium]|nr:galactose mutarotase [Actinomycetota bacterium]
MESEPFGTTRDGRAVARHRLRNARGTEAVFIDYGATSTELHVDGVDVVLGFDDLAGYEAERTWFGCVVGRVANRIADASFEVDGRRFEVEANQDGHHLHGGSQGLSTRVWSASPAEGGDESAIRFSCVSEDGEGGYPGRVEVEVTYRLTDDDRLRIEYAASVDRPTPVNLTHHAYFNLAGAGDVLGHELEIAGDRIVGVDGDLIPTGQLLAVAGTPHDFRVAKLVGCDFDQLDGAGYDVSYVLAGFDEIGAAG